MAPKIPVAACQGRRSEPFLTAPEASVRFTPNSGHVQCNSICPLSATSGHERGLPSLEGHSVVNRPNLETCEAWLDLMTGQHIADLRNGP